MFFKNYHLSLIMRANKNERRRRCVEWMIVTKQKGTQGITGWKGRTHDEVNRRRWINDDSDETKTNASVARHYSTIDVPFGATKMRQKHARNNETLWHWKRDLKYSQKKKNRKYWIRALTNFYGQTTITQITRLVSPVSHRNILLSPPTDTAVTQSTEMITRKEMTITIEIHHSWLLA
jgi:hypothetical protein